MTESLSRLSDRRRLEIYYASADGEFDQLGLLVNIELAHEVVPVSVDGLRRYRQFVGDLGTGLALNDQLEHLFFATG